MKLRKVFNSIKEGRLPRVGYMIKRIWQYADKYSKICGKPKILIFADYIRCALIFGCSGIDYFLYRFYAISDKEKRNFATDLFETNFEKAHTDAQLDAMSEDKEETLVFFEEFMRREWCGIKYNNSLEEYAAFYENRDKAILKPLNGMGGRGVELIGVKEKFKNSVAMRDYCLKNNMLIEAIIPQHEALNKIYPNAINTIRVLTLRGKVIGAAIRMGTGTAFVDNAHSGGIFAEMDVAKGKIIGNATNYNDEHYAEHPTTKTKFDGYQLPFWQDSIAMCEQAAEKIDKLWLVGWDVAITPAGPTFVEVNTHPGLDLVQAPNGHGIKAEFDKVR